MDPKLTHTYIRPYIHTHTYMCFVCAYVHTCGNVYNYAYMCNISKKYLLEFSTSFNL